MPSLDEILLKRSLIGIGPTPAAPGNPGPPFTAQDAAEINAILSQMGEIIFTFNAAIGGSLFVTLNRFENDPRGKDDPDAKAVVRFTELVASPIVAARLVVDAMLADQPFGLARRVVLDLLDEVENNVIGMLIAEASRKGNDPSETAQLVGRFRENASANLGAISELVDELARRPNARFSVATLPGTEIQHGDIATGYRGASVFMLEALAGTRNVEVINSHLSPLVMITPIVAADGLRKAVEVFIKAVGRIIGPRVRQGAILQIDSKRAAMALARSTVVAARRLAEQPLIPSERVLFGGSRVFFNAWRLLESSDKASAVRLANQVAVAEFVTQPTNVGTAVMELYTLRLFQKASKVSGLQKETSIFLFNLANSAKAGLFPQRITYQAGFATRQNSREMGNFLRQLSADELFKTDQVIESLIQKAKRGQSGGKYAQRYSEILRATEAIVVGKGIRISRLMRVARDAKQAEALIQKELSVALAAVPNIPARNVIPTPEVAKVASAGMAASEAQSLDRAIRQLPNRQLVLNRIRTDLDEWRQQLSSLVDLAQKEVVGDINVNLQNVLTAVRLMDDAAIRVRRGFEELRAVTRDPAEQSVLNHLENSYLKRVELLTSNARTALVEKIRNGEIPFNLLAAALGSGIFLTGLSVSNDAIALVGEDPNRADLFMHHARTARLSAEISVRFIGPEVFGTPAAVDAITAAANAVDDASNTVDGEIAEGSKQDIQEALGQHRAAVADLGTIVGDQRENLTPTGAEWVDYLLRYAETDIFVTENEGNAAIPEAQDIPEC